MTTGKWWVVWRGRNVGITHSARKPKGIAQGPFPSRSAATTAGLRKLRNPAKRPRRTKKRLRTMSAMKFFRQHGGSVVGRNAEVALVLARAEQYAKQHGWRVIWSDDPDPDLSWASEAERENIREVMIATLVDDQEPPRGPNVLASLGGIVDPDRDYMRVVEAELAAEAAPGRSLSHSNPPTRAARRFISKKIRRLAHEGMQAPRRIGAAFNMARARGFRVPRKNPPLRDFKSLAPHQAEITHGNLRVFYSYDTPVALIDSYYGAFRTTKKWSKTTARHLFAWLRKNGYEPGRVEPVEQDVIDMAVMVGSIDYAKHEKLSRELDNHPGRRARNGVTGRMVPTGRLHRPNPMLTVLGNPGGEAVQTFSNEAVELSYVHRFDPEGKNVIRHHKFEKPVSITALKDGRVVLWRRDGKPVWEDDGQGD